MADSTAKAIGRAAERATPTDRSSDSWGSRQSGHPCPMGWRFCGHPASPTSGGELFQGYPVASFVDPLLGVPPSRSGDCYGSTTSRCLLASRATLSWVLYLVADCGSGDQSRFQMVSSAVWPSALTGWVSREHPQYSISPEHSPPVSSLTPPSSTALLDLLPQQDSLEAVMEPLDRSRDSWSAHHPGHHRIVDCTAPLMTRQPLTLQSTQYRSLTDRSSLVTLSTPNRELG